MVYERTENIDKLIESKFLSGFFVVLGEFGFKGFGQDKEFSL